MKDEFVILYKYYKHILTEYNGHSAEPIIPEEVEVIDEGVFENCDHIMSIRIPPNVEDIHYNAFSGCTNLKSVIMEGVRIIGECAFENCLSLTYVQLAECTSQIRSNAFSCCKKLPSIIFPKNVEEIWDEAFYQCENLTSLFFQEYLLRDIHREAFLGCTALSRIRIGDEVYIARDHVTENINYWDPHRMFPGITYRNFDEESEFIVVNPEITNKEETVEIKYLQMTLQEKHEDDFDIFNGNLIQYKGNQTEIIIPQNITTIDNSSFINNKTITSVIIPKGVQRICDNAFSGCSNLESIVLQEGLKEIGESAFSDCVALTNIQLPSTVNEIGGKAFSGCNNLTSVIIHEGVKWIGHHAFFNCTNLKSIKIPDGIREINAFTFLNCTSLSSVLIPGRVKVIGDGAFGGCTSLSSIVIPENVESIGERAFIKCSSLSDVQILARVKVIENDAFYKCISLTSIKIPEGVQIIGESAFKGCALLKDVDIPSTIIEIKKEAFSETLFLERLYDSFFMIDDRLISYDGKETEVQITNNVRIINTGAFKNNQNLRSVIIPKSVEQIGEYAFQGCDNLTETVIHANLKEISATSFDNLGQREISIIYQQTSPTRTIFGKNESDTISLLDKNNNLQGKLYIPRIQSWRYRPEVQPIKAYVEFIARLIGGMVKHLSEYDAIFPHCNISSPERVKIALTRLQYSLELSDEYKDAYMAYLQNVSHYRVPVLIRDNDISMLQTLARHNAFYRQDIEMFIEQANQSGKTEIQAFLMDYKNKTWGKEPVPQIKLSEKFDPEDWFVHENVDGSLTVHRYLGDEVNITIRANIDGKIVKKIDGWYIGDVKVNLFSSRRDKIESVVIENGIEEIAKRAFLECHNLSSIVIPASVKKVGEEAFYGCENLVIRAPKDSYAIQVARENDIKFEEI